MTRKYTLGGLVLALAAIGLVLVATGSATPKQEGFKAAWIYVGPHTDGGWSQAHDAGRLKVQKALGSKVTTTYKESVPEGPQVAQVIESLIRDGNKMIFATSFGFQTAMVAAAEKHPDVYFEMATGTAQSKNMAEYFGASEDAIYLSGMAAGAATKKGTIGYIVPFPIPEVIRHANAFTLGAQAVRNEREGAPRLDALLVRPEEGEASGREPRRRAAPTCSARTWTARPRASTRSRRRSRGSATTPTRRSSRRPRGSPPRSTTGVPTTCPG